MAARKKTTAKVENFTAKTTETIQDNVEKMTQSFADMGDFGKANVEAAIEAATVTAKGFETVSQEAASFSKKMFEDGVEAAKSITTVKTPQAFIEKQTEYTRSLIDAQVAQFTKMSDMMLGLSKDAVEPIGKRYTALVDMVQSYRA